MNCTYCFSSCIKRGITKKGIQRYQCKHCKKFQQQDYVRARIPQEKYRWVKELTCEGCGINSIARLLNIAKSSVQRIIEKIASKITIPQYKEENQSYEMDELRTYCGNKKNELWLMYVINKTTGKVIDFCVGRRTKENISKVVQVVLKLNPKKIYTDRLNIYPSLIPDRIHRIFQYCTNKIERHNLTLRTHLKRLTRRSICYNKSEEMLGYCVRLYLTPSPSLFPK